MAQRGVRFGLAAVVLGWCSIVTAQTTAGLSTTIVFPLSAQTPSFGGAITLYNPGPNALTASVSFYEGNNSSAPGAKVCNDVVVSSNRSVQIMLATQCALAAGGHFGLLVIADKAVPQSHPFYGYMRVQTPQGQGFSVEGFPVTNFNNQVSHSVGLKRQAAAPTFQTNCFVASLDQPVSYELRLFNDTSGAQIGGTLSGSLQPFQQFRYLDVFGPNGVNAPAGDQLNVRAQFTPTSGGNANLIGFCTVQDNTSFGADFRIAKSFGSPSGSFFVQGGNAFGTMATLGTNDNNELEIKVNAARVMRFQPASPTPNIFGGFTNNGAYAGVYGATIAGGGAPGTAEPIFGRSCPYAFGCQNSATEHYGTIGGGVGNLVGDTDGDLTNRPYGTVAGGFANSASDFGSVGGGSKNQALGSSATVGGGEINLASGFISTVAGGAANVAAGDYSMVAGGVGNAANGSFSFVAGGIQNAAHGASSFAAGNLAKATASGEFVWADDRVFDFDPAVSGWANARNTFNVRATGGVWFLTGVDAIGQPLTGCSLFAGSGSWSCTSSRDAKMGFDSTDTVDILRKVVALPIETWRFRTESEEVRHIGPMAQDFRAAFGLGHNDTTIHTVDADGVALAAIQGLHRLVQEKDAKIDAQAREIDKLRDRMSRIEALLPAQSAAR